MDTYKKDMEYIGLYEISLIINEVASTLDVITDELDAELAFVSKYLKNNGAESYLCRSISFIPIFHMLYRNLNDLHGEVKALEERETGRARRREKL